MIQKYVFLRLFQGGQQSDRRTETKTQFEMIHCANFTLKRDSSSIESDLLQNFDMALNGKV